MRKLTLLLLAVLALQACSENKDSYQITVELEGSEGKWAKLMSRVDRDYVTMDSILVEAGKKALMEGSVEGVNTMMLTVEDLEGSVQLLMENASYKVSGTMEEAVIETDSKAQGDLNAYNAKIKPLRDNMIALVNEIRGGAEAEKRDSLMEAYYKLYDEQQVVDSVYIAENPSSFATVLALRGMYYAMDVDQLEATLNSLDSSLHQMEEYKHMYETMERMKAVAIGKTYVDFGLETPEGELLKISDVHQGNVLLIDFWASWCGPCRRANPELVEIYHEYHEKGFEIIGVSLDRDKESWLKGIEEDKLVWNHISDIKFWDSEGAKLYGVSAIPHTVLIDREGTISFKNIHGQALRDAIESLL